MGVRASQFLQHRPANVVLHGRDDTRYLEHGQVPGLRCGHCQTVKWAPCKVNGAKFGAQAILAPHLANVITRGRTRITAVNITVPECLLVLVRELLVQTVKDISELG